MEKLEKIPALIIAYLTCCSALYLMAYWDTFYINGLPFIAAGDLLKAAIYSFAGSIPALLLSDLLVKKALVDTKLIHQCSLAPDWKNKKSGIWIQTLLMLVWTAACYWLYLVALDTAWIVWAFVLAFPLALYIEDVCMPFLQTDQQYIRRTLLKLAVYLPAFAYATGKKNGSRIYNNISYEYIVQPQAGKEKSSTDTLKIIGQTEKYLLLSTLNNKDIIQVSLDKMDTIVIKRKREKGRD